VSRNPEGPGWVPPAFPVVQHRGLRGRLNLRNAALVLVAAGLVTCLVPVAMVGYGMWQEDQLTRSWAGSRTANLPSPPFIEEASPSTGAVAQSPATPVPAPNSPAFQALFAIRVPKIGYYAAVRQGVSLNILATGPGHYPTTAMPGSPGLVGIAAHNTFWIPFGQLGAGDVVILEARNGTFTYRVTGTRIVQPDDRTVLVSTSTPRLVLTTCWPLWAGSLAAQRLAIFAQQV
jgi:LPXTG-site transpeptidase (sortase) family protein